MLTSCLPAAAWPELDQLAGLPTIAANVVLAQQKAVQIGECKPDEEIFVALARRMKLPVCTEPVKSVLDAQLRPRRSHITFDELKQKGFIKLPVKYRKYENGGFKTPTGKIELYPTRFEQLGYAPLPYKSRRKARFARPNCCAISSGADDRREDLILFQLGTSSTRKTSQSSTRSSCGNPP